MAEIPVLGALKVIGSALAQESARATITWLGIGVSQTTNVHNSIKRIKEDLERIQRFLGVADSVVHDEDIAEWMVDIRTTAHDVEDVVDDFNYKIYGGGPAAGGGVPGLLHRARRHMAHIPALREISSRLETVEIKVRGFLNAQNHFMTNRLALLLKEEESTALISRGRGGPSRHTGSYHGTDEDDVVGTQSNEEFLTRQLTDEEVLAEGSKQPPVVIAVWGMGGLGKTTLVRKVYKKAKLSFDCCAWISVTEAYKAGDLLLLRRMLEELRRSTLKELRRESEEVENKNHAIDGMESEELVGNIRSVLEGKRPRGQVLRGAGTIGSLQVFNHFMVY